MPLRLAQVEALPRKGAVRAAGVHEYRTQNTKYRILNTFVSGIE
jgi:hypothetical protein